VRRLTVVVSRQLRRCRCCNSNTSFLSIPRLCVTSLSYVDDSRSWFSTRCLASTRLRRAASLACWSLASRAFYINSTHANRAPITYRLAYITYFICHSSCVGINVKNFHGSLTTVVRAQNDRSKTANITDTIFDRTYWYSPYKRRRFENR